MLDKLSKKYIPLKESSYEKMEKLGDFLRKKREELGFSLREVEKRTSISNAYLSQLEHQKIIQPSPSILEKLAKCYDVSYVQLMILAGHPIELKKTDRSRTFRTSRGLEEITKNEEKELLEFLRFLRSRGKQ